MVFFLQDSDNIGGPPEVANLHEIVGVSFRQQTYGETFIKILSLEERRVLRTPRDINMITKHDDPVTNICEERLLRDS